MRNYFIINADGLDCSGKETFCKSLMYHLNEEFKYNDGTVKIQTHSFPTYDTPIGQKIKEALQLPIDERLDMDQMHELFFADRKAYMKEFVDMCEREKNVFHILVLDRYYYSSFFYDLAVELPKSAPKEEVVCTLSYKHLIQEKKALPMIDQLVLFARFYGERADEARTIHMSLIKSKKNKDANETFEFQDKVNTSVVNSLNLIDVPVLRQVVIGSNFNDHELENMITSDTRDAMVKWMKEQPCYNHNNY